MKKRLEDQLIELAFDLKSDSIPPELAKDSAAKARLNEYRVMRNALGQLRDIPEHQMSTERLREALLHQGLKRRYQFPWHSLSYGVAACTLFFSAFFISRTLRTSHGNPRIVENPGALAAASSSIDPFSILSMPSESGHATAHTVAMHALRHHHRAPRELIRRIPGPTLAFNEKSGANTMLTSFSPNASKPGVEVDGDGNPISHASNSSEPAGVNRDTFIVIKPGTDSGTGLDTAQEIPSSNNNVLVGG